MSGKRIDDHKFWAGGPGKNMVMPQGVHTKAESSAMSAGAVSEYEDTTEEIKKFQNMGDSKVKGHPRKAGHRN